MSHLTRRTFVGSVASLGVAATLPAFGQGPAPGAFLKKAIPSTGEQIPAIGLGTWITFNVGSNEKLRAARAQVMQTFFDSGGRLIDSSPMYGSSEAVIGHGLADVTSDEVSAGINGFAAGGLLVLLADTMIPEAREKGGRIAGLVLVLGFALAAGLSTVS